MNACWPILLPLPLVCGAAGCEVERFRALSDDFTAGETTAEVTSSAEEAPDASGTSRGDVTTSSHDEGTPDAPTSSSSTTSDQSTALTEQSSTVATPDVDAGMGSEASSEKSTATLDASVSPDAAPSSSVGETNYADGGVVVDAGTSSAGDTGSAPPLEPGICNSGEFEAPKQVLGLGFDDKLWGPAISADGNTLYFGHTTLHEDLYSATIQPDRVRTFQDVTPLTTLNTSRNEGTPFITVDGLSLYYYAIRQGGPGERDLWHASRASLSEEFSEPKQVMGVNGPSYDHLPWLSDNELTIYYTTERLGGLGRSDIWQATRLSKNMPFAGHRLVPGINSSAREDSLAFSPDRLTVYFSTDRGTTGDLDIWQATRAARGENFSNPQPLAHLNSSADDTNLAMTRDGTRLYFSSGREGGQRIWVAIRSCQ